MSLTIDSLRLKHVESTMLRPSYKTPLDTDCKIDITCQRVAGERFYVFFTAYKVTASYTEPDWDAVAKDPALQAAFNAKQLPMAQLPTVTHDVWVCQVTFATTAEADQPVDDARLHRWAHTTLLRWQHDYLREHLHWLSGAAGLTPLLIEPPADLIREEMGVLAGLSALPRPTTPART